MRVKIDKKDKQILYQLDINARQSNSKIAKIVKLSRDAVGYRIKKLEEKGIIKGYTTIINSEKLGFIKYRVMFNLIDISPQKIKELIEFLKNDKRVGWISKTDGIWNFGFAVWVKSNLEFRDFYNINFYKKFKKYIKESLITPMTAYRHFDRNYLIEKDHKIKIETIQNEEKEKYDSIDIHILQQLTNNAKIQLLEIAQSLNLDSMTVHHRIKNLEKNGIITGYKVNLDCNLLKKEFYSVKINFNDINRLTEFENYIKTIPEVIAIIETIGGYDFDIDLEIDNITRYFEIINDIENKFDFIREIMYFRNLKNYKILFMPNM